MRLHLIKAAHGDGMLLESGDAEPARLLVDGGPSGCWDAHLNPYLKEVLGEEGRVEALLVSHVDLDHIVAPLDLFAELERRRVGQEPKWPAVADLWHNSFERALGEAATAALAAMRATAANAASLGVGSSDSNWTLMGIGEGARLRRSATREGVPLNLAFGGGLICPDDLEDATVRLGAMSIRVIGPTRRNLDALRDKWMTWVEKAKRSRRKEDLANVDQSVPNLSSIVVLAEEAGRTILLTGDARGDHIEQGLQQAGLLSDGRCHVNVLKVQHHGSARNVDRGFFDRITADVYAISADGRYDNPDIATLRWIVEAAKAVERPIRIAATWSTPSLINLQEEMAPGEYGYEVVTVAEGKHALAIDV